MKHESEALKLYKKSEKIIGKLQISQSTRSKLKFLNRDIVGKIVESLFGCQLDNSRPRWALIERF